MENNIITLPGKIDVSQVQGIYGIIDSQEIKRAIIPIQEGNDTNISETIINTRASIDGAFVLQQGEKVSGTIVDIILFGNGFMSHPTCEYRGECYYIYHQMSNDKLSKLQYAIISFYGNSLAIEEPAWVIKYKSSTTYPLTSSQKNTGFYIGAIGDGNGNQLNSIEQTTIRDWHYITAQGNFSISAKTDLVYGVTADELYIPCRDFFTNPVFESCNISKLIFTASSVYFPNISSSFFSNCTIGSIYVSDSLVDQWKSALGSDYSSKIYPISEL